ncbi:hypothetical protein [Crossiella sp. CA198]|uniref:hypothetical protein n=1 Tax=Crossiella sp. CA198 TaxID=3455607 RepID=UPI003F8CF2EF
MTNPDAGTQPQPAAPRFVAIIRQDYSQQGRVRAVVEDFGGQITRWVYVRSGTAVRRDPLDRLPAPHLFDAIVLASPESYSRQFIELVRLMNWARLHGKMLVDAETSRNLMDSPLSLPILGVILELAEFEERIKDQERRLRVRMARGRKFRGV